MKIKVQAISIRRCSWRPLILLQIQLPAQVQKVQQGRRPAVGKGRTAGKNRQRFAPSLAQLLHQHNHHLLALLFPHNVPQRAQKCSEISPGFGSMKGHPMYSAFLCRSGLRAVAYMICSPFLPWASIWWHQYQHMLWCRSAPYTPHIFEFALTQWKMEPLGVNQVLKWKRLFWLKFGRLSLDENC